MGSVREHQSHGSRDRMDDRRPLSPRRSRVMSDREDRTLPPISHLLPDIGPSHGRPRSRGSNNSPPSHYPAPPSSTSRGSSDHSPSYRYQIPPPPASNRPVSPVHGYGDRYSSSHDRYELPHHSGPPPADRSHSSHSRDAYAGKLPQSSVSSSSPYATQPSGYRGTPYSAPGADPRRRDEEQPTSLPPPPPPSYHGGSAGHSPYSEPRGYPNGDGRYDHYPPPALSQPYSPSSVDAPRSYDPRMGPPAGTPGGPYHAPHHHQYSQLPPLSGGHYPPSDEPARKRRGNLPRWTTDIFKAWFLEHIAHPYPSEQEKNELCVQTGCSMTQISNWFINARRRQTPVLTRQAEAERRLRDTATGRSSSNSE